MFRRLPELKKKIALAEKLESIEKKERRSLFSNICRALEIKGPLNKNSTGIMYQLVKLISAQELNVFDLVDEWLADKPGDRSLPYNERPKRFYAYVKYERLTKEDSVIMAVYLEVVKEFSEMRIPVKSQEFKDCDFRTRLANWFGKPAGNTFEDVLIDFLLVVFKEVRRFNRSLLAKPKTILGDFGWRVFDAWVADNYGGVNGYRLPTRADRNKTNEERSKLIERARERYKALEQGDVKTFDRLGANLWNEL